MSSAGEGHLFLLLPIVRALRDAGHEVLVALNADYAVAGRNADVPICLVESMRTSPEEMWATRRALERARPQDRGRMAFGDFLAKAEASMAELDAIAAEFRPDAILRETMAFGAQFLAERNGLPSILVEYFPRATEARDLVARDLFSNVRRRFELDPGAPSRDAATLLYGPPSWFSRAPEGAIHLRPADGVAAPEEGPDWLGGMRMPLIYATLGTVFNSEPGLWGMLLEGLASVDAGVVATVGRDVEPASLGPQPDHIRLEQFVPQATILNRAAAAVTHGGFGSLMGCLSRGVPIVSIPLASGDNTPNALQVEKLGAGIAILPADRSPARIAEATRAVLHDPQYRLAAQSIAADIAALPEASYAVEVIEELTRH